ncbi:trehalase family glycosidase [Dinghuibacter silviterrae]|uniref:Alpha,alpha-trehalase n=1 Tax=Dinghuibacter silviterrae TaxID=1539049 RepID=A0A4R8DPH3_9BACT|nr:trehalase family glycosidase [Dinghuibacter silviterrae]TDW99758.1 alpha,alpha-trehalase [Dinghuibacter silviterrae]
MKNKTVFVEDFGELFVDIQLGEVLDDQKTFVDCEPRLPARQILERYRKEKQKPGFQLRAFFDKYFDLPNGEASLHLGKLSIDAYIDVMWGALTRRSTNAYSTLIPLPEPFVVPGGRFGEIFYWDSFFTMLGLKVAGKTELLAGMLRNFAYLIDVYGFIPNANRTYFLSRSQPPFFSLMLELCPGSLAVYASQLEKEYAFWMEGEATGEGTIRHVVRMPGGEHLNRYWDERDTPRPEGYKHDLDLAAGHGHPGLFRHLRAGGESGWDFSSRWLADGRSPQSIRTTDLVPVDLNCLLLLLERALEKAFKGERAAHYRLRAQRREGAIQRYLWNPGTGCFGDYDLVQAQPCPAPTAAMVFPLFAGVATSEQAMRTAALLDRHFLRPGGLLTTLAYTEMQWDAPNGWAPLQWVACQGLQRYGLEGMAGRIKRNWMWAVETVYAGTGKLMEKYNVEDPMNRAVHGEYLNQEGFGWTNGVYTDFKYSH